MNERHNRFRVLAEPNSRALRVCVGMLVMCCASSSMVVSQELANTRPSLTNDSIGNASEADTTSDDERLAAIFAGSVPQSIEDLKAMQRMQQAVSSQVVNFTVSVRVGSAQGSGVVVSKDGYVLTAAHVAGKPNQRAYIILADGRMVRGKTLGSHRAVDAGLVKIESQGEFPFAKFGSSADLNTGQWVFVAGHPGGYSADRKPVVRLGRLLKVSDDSLVTDCPLIGGDSGGPVFDANGDVVGINSRIGTALTANIHVPVDLFRDSWERLAKAQVWGYLPGHRPMIGVQGKQNATTALVVKVFEGSPAKRAGIKPGDVVVEFAGSQIASFESLQQLVESSFPGDTVDLKVKRGDTVQRLKLTIGKAG